VIEGEILQLFIQRTKNPDGFEDLMVIEDFFVFSCFESDDFQQEGFFKSLCFIHRG